MKTSSSKAYDLVVIGSGPAGQRAAMAAAKVGKRAAIVELQPAVGGGCVHQGTLPSKSFRESIYRWSLGSRGTLGRMAEHHRPAKMSAELPDMKRLLSRRDRVVAGESLVIHDQLKRNDIDIYHGRGRLVSPNEVEVEGPGKRRLRLHAEFIFIAVGARPIAPAHLAVDGTHVVDSNSVLGLKRVPRTMMVLGAGIIGAEYASMFSMAGTKVYLVDRRHEILAAVDREVVTHLSERFESEKVEILLKLEALKLEKLGTKANPQVRVHLSNGRKITVDCVLVTLGRNGNTEGLGLEDVGVDRDARGLIAVDPFYRTTVPNIYAVGDVVGAPALASTSYEQGRIASSHAFQLETDATLSPLFPYGIYTIPEISMVGPTEEDLVARKVDFVVGRARYGELARGQIVGDEWGLLKLLVERRTLKLLGVHIVGDNAADLVHIGQAVMALGGDASYFIGTVFNYPTLAEAYKTAAFDALNQIKGRTKPPQGAKAKGGNG